MILRKTRAWAKAHRVRLLFIPPVLLVLAAGLANLQLFRYSFNSLSQFTATNGSNPITAQNPIVIHFTTPYRRLTSVAMRFSVPDGGIPGKTLTMELRDGTNRPVAAETVALSPPEAASAFHRLALPHAAERGQEYSLYVTTRNLTPEDGVRIATGNWTKPHVTSWYWGEQREPDMPEVALEYTRFGTPSFIAFLFPLSFALFAVFMPELKKRSHRLLWHIGLLAAAPAALLAVTERLNLGGLSMLQPAALPLNYALLLPVPLLLLALTNRFSVAHIGASGLVLAAAAANHYVLLFRRTVILPADLYSMGTAANVLSQYEFAFTLPVLFAMALWLAVAGAAVRNPVAVKGAAWRLGWGGGALALAAASVFACSSPARFSAWNIAPNHFAQTSSSRLNGFFLNFALNVPDLFQRPPEGYNPGAVAEDMPAGKAGNGETPHIILIMNESLADFSRFGDTLASRDPLPFIHSLAQNPAAHVGGMVVPTFGANTSSSEFEALCQFSLALDYRSLAPFSQYVHNELPALPRYMGRLGYKTLGTHPAAGSNWERARAYPLLGFDDSDFIDSYNGRELINGLVSDRGVYGYIIDYYEANHSQPLFMFGVTLQNHGGYSHVPQVAPEELIQLAPIPGGASASSAQNYLSLAASSDRAFQELLRYFETVDEPVMIVLFGDHLPSVSQEYYDHLFGKPQNDMTAGELMGYYTTPLVAWSNYGADLSALPPLLSCHFLGSQIKQAAGLPLSPLDVWQLELAAAFPVLSKSGTVDAAGRFEPSPQGFVPQPWLDRYGCLQYGALFDTAGRLAPLYLPPGGR